MAKPPGTDLHHQANVGATVIALANLAALGLLIGFAGASRRVLDTIERCPAGARLASMTLDARQVVAAVVDAWNGASTDRLGSLLAPAYRGHMLGAPNGERDAAAYPAAIGGFRDRFPGVEFRVVEQLDAGDRLVSRLEARRQAPTRKPRASARASTSPGSTTPADWPRNGRSGPAGSRKRRRRAPARVSRALDPDVVEAGLDQVVGAAVGGHEEQADRLARERR